MYCTRIKVQVDLIRECKDVHHPIESCCAATFQYVLPPQTLLAINAVKIVGSRKSLLNNRQRVERIACELHSGCILVLRDVMVMIPVQLQKAGK